MISPIANGRCMICSPLPTELVRRRVDVHSKKSRKMEMLSPEHTFHAPALDVSDDDPGVQPIEVPPQEDEMLQSNIVGTLVRNCKLCKWQHFSTIHKIKKLYYVIMHAFE